MRSWPYLGLTGVALGTTLLACAALAQACTLASACGTVATHPNLWLLGSIGPIAILVVGSALLSAARAVWLLQGAARSVRQLPRELCSRELDAAIGRTSLRHVECLACDAPLACCVGVLRPRILVTRGLVTLLRPDELEAVLLHEQHHGRRRDLLRYAIRRAVADICFYLPLLSWWARHQIERAELGGDRTAMRRVGPRPLAGALWVVGTRSNPLGTPAFHGTAELRVAQVLGDPLPDCHPERSLWLTSGVGLLAAFGLASCLSQVLLAFR